MPKLEDYDNSGFNNPVSPTAAQKIANSPSLNSTNVTIDYAASVKATADAAAVTTAGGADTKVELDKDAQDWVNKKWRPMMGWMYMATCSFDFIVAPVLWSIVQALGQGQVSMQWQPLTLQGAGLYHVAMGAVLGIAAYGRTKEKLESKTS